MIVARFDSFPAARGLAQILMEELGIESQIDAVPTTEISNDEGVAYELTVFVKLEDPAGYR